MKAIYRWKESMEKIWREGHLYVDTSNRRCKELMNLVVTIENPSKEDIDGPVNSLIKSNNWFYPSKEEIAEVMFKELHSPVYDYTYGGRIFNYANEIDQVNDFVIPLLESDPDSRRGVIALYNPLKDAFLDRRNIPSAMYLYARMMNGKLHLTGCYRSVDFFFGWPANLYQLYCVQKLLCKRLDLELGSITLISNSAHLFETTLDYIREIHGDIL